MDFDWNSPIFGLAIRSVAMVLFIVVFVLQLIANSRFSVWDKYSWTRIILTFLLSGKIILMAPGIGYLILRLLGGDDETWRSIATITTSLAFLFVGINLVVLYLQKEK